MSAGTTAKDSTVAAEQAAKLKELVRELKLKICKTYGKEILELPSMSEKLPVIKKSDEPEVRQLKEREKTRILRLREAEYEQLLPQVVDRLDTIIDRVRTAIRDAGTSASIFTGSNQNRHVDLQLRMSKDRCPKCGNQNINNVLEVQGESICKGKDGQGCGYVFASNIIHLGAEKRIFEGEEDLNHSGPAANPLLSDAYNMRTSMVMFNDKGNSKLNKLRRTQLSVEYNINDLEHDDGRTKGDTRDRQKAKVFDRMEVISINLHIHYIAVHRAKEIFALYRQIRENLHDFDATIHACLVMGYEDVGIHLLAEEAGMEQDRLIDEAIQQRQNEVANGVSVISSSTNRKTPDLALDTIPDVPLGRFAMEEIREWLTENGKKMYTDEKSASFIQQSLVEQMIRVIEYLVDSKFKEMSNNSATTQKQSEKVNRQAQIAELSKGLFGSTMAGRKRLLTSSSTHNNTNALSSSSTAANVLSSSNQQQPSATTEVMPGQALLTLSFFQVTRFIRQLQQQIASSSSTATTTTSEAEDQGSAMQVDEHNEEDEEEEDETRSMASSSILKTTRTTVPKIPETVINTILPTASARTEVMLWNEERMTACETHFRQAINRRVLYDTRRKEMLKNKRQEAHRLFVEQQPSSLSAIIHQKQAILVGNNGQNKPSNAINDTKPVVKKEEKVSHATFDDDLEDFFGGPITVVRAPVTTTAGASAASTTATIAGFTTGTAISAAVVNNNGSAAPVATAVKTEPAGGSDTAVKATTNKEVDIGAPPPAKKPRFVVKR